MKRWTSYMAVGILVVAMLALPAAASADVTVHLSQRDSADPVQPGALVTYTVSVRNVGSDPTPPHFTVELAAFGIDSNKAVNNPYRSARSTKGTCEITNTDAADPGSYGYKWVDCTIGVLAPGATATITAVVEMNESMDHDVGVLEGAEYTPLPRERTTVSTPATVRGSTKIKLKGLPQGCATGDFTLKAKAKPNDVKKMVAALEGKKLEVVKDDKLKATVPATELEYGFHDLKLSAKRESGAKLKTAVTFQRC
jgi:hypothetical protein